MTQFSRPEIRVLLASVRPNAVAAPEIPSQGQLDWEYLLALARRHAVLPLLYRGLQSGLPPQPPPPVTDLLRQACLRSQRRNLAITAELLRVLQALEKADIPALPFKGPVLAALAYGDIALRTFGDLDVLVHEEDVARARKVLVAEGYVQEYTLTEEQERAYRKAECALQLRHPGRDVVLELHWLLTERYLSVDLPASGFWEGLEPVPLAGRSVPAFALENLLLYLCVHGSKHQWERLEWLCSLSELIAGRHDIEWSEVVRRARRSGTRRMLHLGLLLAHELLGLDLPDAVRREIEKDRAAQSLAREIAEGLFDHETERAGNRGSWYLYLLRSRERLRDRVRIVLFSFLRLPHPCSEELVALPSRLTFLYYLFRPARMLTASVAVAWRHATHRGRRDHSESVCTR